MYRERDYDETLDKDNEFYLSVIEVKSTRILSRLKMRVVAFGRDQTDAKDLIKSAKGSIGTFSSGHVNSLRARGWWWFRTFRPLFRWEYSKRIYSMERMKKRVVPGTEEMAAMMRLPNERVQNIKLNQLKMSPTPLPKEVKEASFTWGFLLSQTKAVCDNDLAFLRYHAAFSVACLVCANQQLCITWLKIYLR
ncbi:hypothetical protein [Jeotgalibacillus terrae]|uniref:Uncharacterized protein n=1 Tax=Jeotgalibacillus terrae TaxID=587735 RepID=A0ABW5ZJG6_9BACL|nr:hypothetical protein [Jeotgalibacillus terrae]MBM7580827.1 hypothetical protein [Jeotgalibacillus terrae]